MQMADRLEGELRQLSKDLVDAGCNGEGLNEIYALLEYFEKINKKRTKGDQPRLTRHYFYPPLAFEPYGSEGRPQLLAAQQFSQVVLQRPFKLQVPKEHPQRHDMPGDRGRSEFLVGQPGNEVGQVLDR